VRAKAKAIGLIDTASNSDLKLKEKTELVRINSS
jgi:hypothetical protein